MRLIPGKTKVKIELFRGITIGDIIVGIVTVVLIGLVLMSTIPGRIYVAAGILAVGGLLVFRMDEQPNYMLVLGLLRYLAFPRRFRRGVTDKELLSKVKNKDISDIKDENDRTRVVWAEQPEKTANSAVKKSSDKKILDMKDIIPFTSIADGFIGYDGKYYGTVIEIDPVEFRFFSKYRRDASIENCLGKVIRSLKPDYSANIVKIDRPILYDSYLDKEYDKLDALKKSYEKGMLTEEELKSRVEIQYDRIKALRTICFEDKVIQPFYYFVIFNSNKKQLEIDTDNALTAMRQGEMKVRRLKKDRDLAIFLKYSNMLDFNEWDADKLDPKDLTQWAMPESLSIAYRTANISGIVTHQLRVVNYPSDVGDAWLAGVMSVPATKVVVKITPMERVKSIRALDRSLQELRTQLNSTGVDSKRIELENHIETLSRLLVTLQQENESLLSVNIYISLYDAVKTSESGNTERVKESSLPVIADMKKTVRRTWQETGMRLNGMDFTQLECFIASQVSAYDPFLKDGRGMPANTIAAMFPWIYARVSDEGGIRLGTQDGVPVFIDFFRRDSERINSNVVIIGKSGSGKSYGTKSLLTNMASEDAKIFILDPENEYMELANTLHGKIINVANAKYGRLNPFHIITTLEDDESEGEHSGSSYSAHLQFLEEFFKQILPDVDKDAFEYLNALVERLYSNFDISADTDLTKLSPEDYPIFDDLYDLVLEDFQNNSNQYVRNLLQSLMNYVSKFASGGRNSVIWNGPSSVTTDENFTVFNFQTLLSNRNSTIANAQMLLVLKYIDNEIIKNRDYNKKYGLKRKIVVVIDEAHVFIDTKYPVALDFMFQLAKRIRKYNGMQIVITQNIKDFVGSEEIARKSTAIINACQYSFIFSLSPNDMDDLCKLYEKAGGINEVEQDQIITAPRGMAFTVMSPTSRSSFMIEVPQTMVDMFEQENYRTHYFNGEDGTEVWEKFIENSRAEHEENVESREPDYVYEDESGLDEDTENVWSGFTFSEISAEEADKLAQEFEMQKLKENRPFRQPAFTEEQPQEEMPEEPHGISLEKHTEEKPAVSLEKQPVFVQPVQPVQPAMDYAAMIEAIRAEVRREIEMQFALNTVKAANAEVKPPSVSKETPPEPVQQTAQTEPPVTEEYEEQKEIFEPQTAQEPEQEDDFEPQFDIMSLLDEQLESYSAMNLVERMQEIDVTVMDISLDELASYIRDTRRKRG